MILTGPIIVRYLDFDRTIETSFNVNFDEIFYFFEGNFLEANWEESFSSQRQNLSRSSVIVVEPHEMLIQRATVRDHKGLMILGRARARSSNYFWWISVLNDGTYTLPFAREAHVSGRTFFSITRCANTKWLISDWRWPDAFSSGPRDHPFPRVQISAP